MSTTRTITLGGDLTVSRMGYGAMRITGPGIIGEPADRDEAKRVLRRPVELGVNFIDTAERHGRIERVARRHGATTMQIALAWLLVRSPTMLVIPGTSKVKHLEENVAAADLILSDADLRELGS